MSWLVAHHPFHDAPACVRTRYLAVGATRQGLLLAAMGVGAVGSAVLIATAGDRLPRGIPDVVSVTLYGLSL